MAFDANITVEGLNKQIEQMRRQEIQNEKLLNNLLEEESKQRRNMALAQYYMNGQKPKAKAGSPTTQAVMPQTQAVGPGGSAIQGYDSDERDTPEAIDPFSVSSGELEPTLTPTGQVTFRRKGAREQIFENISEIKQRGESLTEKEQEFYDKYVGMTTETLRDDLKKAESGEMTYKQVRKKYPDQAKAIKQSQVGSLNNRTQNVIRQVESAVDEVEMKEMLRELLEREDEAIGKGVDIDVILDLYGLTRDGILEEGE